jgi:hypothetical protein
MKEFRALWVPWVCCLAVMTGCALAGGLWSRLVMPTYFLGAIALGALSMGRPATALSSQRTTALVLPVLYGLLVAPWLTMVCRSALAGTVFSLAIPGLLLTTGAVIAATKYGSHSEAEHFSMSLLWGGTLGLCAMGGVMGWRTFMRLEATEGRGTEIRLPQWLRLSRAVSPPSGLTRHHPVWLLIQKELHLQQMALAVSGLYVAGWAGVVTMRYLAPDLELDFFNVLSGFYSGVIALIIGSLACAEERQMGTLDSQVLLPMASSQQWSVKVGVVLGLSMMLALALPQLLTGGHSLLPSEARSMLSAWLLTAIPIVLLTVGGLYVSSLCSSGLWALLMSLPALWGAVLLVWLLTDPMERVAFLIVWRLEPYMIPHSAGDDAVVVVLLLGAGVLAVVLRLALANYRSADRGPTRIGMQLICIASCLFVAMLLSSAVAAINAGPRLPTRPQADAPTTNKPDVPASPAESRAGSAGR